jgi:hypothetical protein
MPFKAGRMSAHSSRLQRKVGLVRPLAQAAASAFWSHPHLREMFPDYLCTVHGAIRATVPLLRLAAACAEVLERVPPATSAICTARWTACR